MSYVNAKFSNRADNLIVLTLHEDDGTLKDSEVLMSPEQMIKWIKDANENSLD